MGLLNRTPLTPEMQAVKDREKARKQRIKAEQARARAERQAAWAEQERQRVAAFPHFVVRETREVTVRAENMNDAISIANKAFKDGQSDDNTVKWGTPFGITGDTVDQIRTTNVKAIEAPRFEED